MKINDLISMCLQNLLRRKSRTLLTMLGVVIGCCSIVIMVSIGIGMNESQQKMLSEMGDLTLITVRQRGTSAKSAKLNASTVAQFRRMDGVVLAAPRLEAGRISFKLYGGKDGRYQTEWSTIIGMNQEDTAKLGYQLIDGSFPNGKEGNAVLVGQYFAYAFADTKRPEGHNTIDIWGQDTNGSAPDPYFKVLETPITLEATIESSGKKLTDTCQPTGILKEDYSKGEETYQGIIMDLDALQNLMARVDRESGRKVEKEPVYSSVLVKVSGINQVAVVEEQIKELGFSTDSMESIRKPMEKEAQQKQMMFGGLGAIALLVAALGITNTMIMSISERTKEIGIMKSLGCYVRDIRTMFLMEAGAIGFLGGVTGSILSALVSVIMNQAAAKDKLNGLGSVLPILTEQGNRLSVIPPWLVLFAIVFSVMIGLGSGYYPANKAVQIPALEAIKQG